MPAIARLILTVLVSGTLALGCSKDPATHAPLAPGTQNLNPKGRPAIEPVKDKPGPGKLPPPPAPPPPPPGS